MYACDSTVLAEPKSWNAFGGWKCSANSNKLQGQCYLAAPRFWEGLLIVPKCLLGGIVISNAYVLFL